MQTEEIFAHLKSYIANELLDGQDDGLEGDTPLLELGIVNSLSMLNLVSHIEETFKVTVPNEQVNPRNFENLDKLVNLVDLLLKETGSTSTSNVHDADLLNMLEAI